MGANCQTRTARLCVWSFRGSTASKASNPLCGSVWSASSRNTWQSIAADEYGFYANVNPTVDHPRWTQARERRLPSGLFKPNVRDTQMFNGYSDRSCFSIYRARSWEELLMRYPLWRIDVFIVAAMWPLVWLYQAWADVLGPDPGKVLVDRLGLGTLVLLLVALSMTPLQKLTGWAGWIAVRRQLGLWCRERVCSFGWLFSVHSWP